MLRMHDNRMSRREHKGMGKSAYACTEVCLVPVFFLRGGWGAPEPTANLGIGHVRVRSRIHNGGPPVRWTSLHEHVFERSTTGPALQSRAYGVLSAGSDSAAENSFGKGPMVGIGP
jgi:hypothetical protein